MFIDVDNVDNLLPIFGQREHRADPQRDVPAAPARRRRGPCAGILRRGSSGTAGAWSPATWSAGDHAGDRRPAGPSVPLPGVFSVMVPDGSAVQASARSICASAVPMPRTRTGRQDTMVVMAHGARVTPACASR
jgi:hypothetical protein